MKLFKTKRPSLEEYLEERKEHLPYCEECSIMTYLKNTGYAWFCDNHKPTFYLESYQYMGEAIKEGDVVINGKTYKRIN